MPSGPAAHNTCFHLAVGERTVLIDCGASAPVGLRARNVDPNSIDAVVLSQPAWRPFRRHPVLMLDGQVISPAREIRLLFGRPSGHHATHRRRDGGVSIRIHQDEISLPVERDGNSGGSADGHPWLNVLSAEVIHSSGAPSTALRVTDGQRTFAYSGDTQWTDALLPIAAGADLFMVECLRLRTRPDRPHELETIKQRFADFTARA